MAKATNLQLSILNVGSYSMKCVRGSFDQNLFQIEGIQNVKNAAQLTSQSSFEDYMGALDKALGEAKTGVFKESTEIHLVMNPTFLMAKIIGMPEFAKGDLEAVMKDRLERDSAVSSKPNGLDAFNTAHILYDKLKEEDKVDDQSDIAVLAVMCERAMVTSLSEMLDRHGFVLTGLWSEVVGLAGLMKRHDPQAFGGSVAVVNIGHNLTTFQIFSEGRCLFFRPIYTAGQQLTKDVLAITNDDTIDFKQAEELKHRMTLAPEDVDPSTLSPLEALIQTISESAALKEFSLIRKLDISFEYLNGNLKKRVSKLFITGGTANLRGILHHVKNNTSLPQGELLELADKVKMLGQLPEDEGKEAYLNAGSAIGLALAIKDGIFQELNLVRRASTSIDLKSIKAWVTENKGVTGYVVEGLIGLLLIGYLGSNYLAVRKTVAVAEAALKGKKDRWEEAEKRKQNYYAGNAAELHGNYNEARNALAFYRAAIEKRVDWTRVLFEVARGASGPASKGRIAINTIDYLLPVGKGEPPFKPTSQELPGIIIQGKALTSEPVNRLSETLKKTDLFKRVEVNKMVKAPPDSKFDGFLFDIVAVPK